MYDTHCNNRWLFFNYSDLSQLTTMSESSSQFGPSLDRHILSESSTHRTSSSWLRNLHHAIQISQRDQLDPVIPPSWVVDRKCSIFSLQISRRK